MATMETEREAWQEQLRVDGQTLRTVVAGLDRLEAQWKAARHTSGALARGYFTPEEDDQVRQMVLAYRNYRVALHEIIFRCRDYAQVPWPDLQRRTFLTGFATALTLYSRSLKLIQTYERVPLVRQKINEPDARWELESGFFEQVLGAYSSLSNYRGLARAGWYWLRNRRELQREADTGDADAPWLVEVIRRERPVTRKRLSHVLLHRLLYDWRLFLQTVFLPVHQTRYSIKSLIGSAGARLRVTGHYRPSLKPALIGCLDAMLEPGDVLLVRAEKKLTSAILPGFWAHAAIYIGNAAAVRELGIAGEPHVARHRVTLEAKGKATGCVIEAVSPVVQLVPLPRCLFADHVLALRPRVSEAVKAGAVAEAFAHLGKAYDFEFDFNVSTRIVCTELVYRCYHNKGSIQFPLIKRLGRFTLSGDDIAKGLIEALRREAQGGLAPFEVIALALGNAAGEAEFVAPADVLPTLERIQEGWRPTTQPEPAYA